MQDDPLLTWLKDRLYGEVVGNDTAPPELAAPEVVRAVEEARSAAREELELWRELRQRGVAPPRSDARRVLGLSVEIGFPEGTDIIVAFADGTSLFFSRVGAALMGEDPRQEVEVAARRLIEEAEAYVVIAEPERGPHRSPPATMVQFTFLTPSGPLVAACSKHALRSGIGKLAPLFEPASELIALKTDFPEAA
ncbi:MAG TPA: hypothetical protein VFA20_25960 [Myxococcaceae bacterium]|nr:hypothetical protein [Myxococcaceae bacterium]